MLPAPAAPVDLVIHGARVVTLDPARPRAEAVAITEGVMVAAGSEEELQGLVGPATRRFDAQDAVLLPGMVDPHLHLLAYAASLRSVDLVGARSISEVRARLRQAAERLPAGAWLRGAGYDDWLLVERRHPTRHDLDGAVPDRPVRVVHRSGHASVLNSLALERAGIGMDTEEPPGGTIDRELPSGAPSGLLIDMEDYLAARIPRLEPEELEKGAQEASHRLLAWGVTAVEDATPNTSEDLRLLARLAESGVFRPALAAMVDARMVRALRAEGIVHGGSLGPLRGREAKVMLSGSSGRLHPSAAELAAVVAEAAALGYPVAIHAVEAEALRIALDALDSATPSLPHRIEHASVCPPDLLDRLRRRERRIVTQPAFLYVNGDRYREEVDATDRPWLYRATAFTGTGLLVAASSDAPVVPPDPRLGLYGAVARRSRSGAPVGADPPLSPAAALALFTTNAATMAGWEGPPSPGTVPHMSGGRIAPGYRADLVLWDRDLSAVVDPPEFLQARVLATFLAGELVYEA